MTTIKVLMGDKEWEVPAHEEVLKMMGRETVFKQLVPDPVKGYRFQQTQDGQWHAFKTGEDK